MCFLKLTHQRVAPALLMILNQSCSLFHRTFPIMYRIWRVKSDFRKTKPVGMCGLGKNKEEYFDIFFCKGLSIYVLSTFPFFFSLSF